MVELLDYGEHHFSNFDYLLNKGYSGIIISPDSPSKNAKNHAIIQENIIPLMRTYKVPPMFDALSIDLNGNDYWVLEKVLEEYRPNLIIAEYNASRTEPETIKYSSYFKWNNDDYYGFSFAAAKKLAEKFGYYIIFQNDELNLYMVAREYVEPEGIIEVTSEKKIFFPHNPNGEWVYV